jgi:TolA-binding protein
VLGGDVVSERLVTPDGPEGALALRSARSGEVQLGAARASLARATEIVWRRERRRVDLRAGSVSFDVEHRPGQSFEVWTPRFVVDVVGTRFSVDLGGVRTERGTVRVLSTDGKLIAYVEAGRSWSLPAASAAAAPAEGPPPREAPPAAPSAVKAPPEAEAPPAVARSPLAGAGDGAVARSPLAGAGDGAVARLASARTSLARGDAAEARRTLEPVLRMGREVAAEARALYAESFLVEGRYTEAEASYRTLIRDFPRTAQAESALYATAQLASEHGRTAEARDAVARYLDRYPRGRFAKEAAELQARLTLPR